VAAAVVAVVVEEGAVLVAVVLAVPVVGVVVAEKPAAERIPDFRLVTCLSSRSAFL
jgi:hypothetical protein